MDEEEARKHKFQVTFGAYLEGLIYKKFQSKDAFLRETGIFKATLHDILTGRADVQLSTLWRIAQGLGVTVRELFPIQEK